MNLRERVRQIEASATPNFSVLPLNRGWIIAEPGYFIIESHTWGVYKSAFTLRRAIIIAVSKGLD